MFSDTKFWRLVWKEYRVQRPLWLVMAILPLLLQGSILVLVWWFSTPPYGKMDEAQGSVFMAIGFVASVVYVLGCCATMFSVEHENATFDFQRVLPANHSRVLWAKIGFAAVSSLMLTTLLWIVTRGVILGIVIPEILQWGAPSASVWFGTYGVLYMAEIFVWGILSSLLIRQPLWAVIVAIAAQSAATQFVFPYRSSGEPGRSVLKQF